MSTPELQPFSDFYRLRGTPLPRIELIPAADLSEPYRWLLDHDGTMTARLQEFYGDTLHIRLLQKRQFEERLARQVALVLDESEEPVEYGAININLTMFGPESRRQIRESRKAFGAILEEFEIAHASRVDCFFRVWADASMKVALNLDGGPVLFGRRNVLVDPETEIPLAETVEILSTNLNPKPE